MTKEVKIIRLNSGEELVAFCEDQGDSYHLEKVTIIIPNEDKEIGLYPFMPYSNIRLSGLDMPKSYVAFVTKGETNLEAYYLELVSPEDKGAGIIMPDSGIITPH
jgi:hypothetical protein